MKGILPAVIIILLFAAAAYPESDAHLVSKSVIYEHSTSYVNMTDRLENAAALYEKYAPVPRIAIYDMAFGADLKEHKKLKGFGVIMISAQCQHEKELPLAGVYFKSGKKRFDLIFLYAKKIEVKSSLTEKVFGKTRMDCFYLIPYAYTGMEGELFADWNGGRAGFSLAKFPAELELEFSAGNRADTPAAKKPVNISFLLEFLSREFSVGGSEAEKVIKESLKKQ